MGTQALTKTTERMPTVFDDFFKPWNEWFDNAGLWGRVMNIPAVNITENKDEYKVALAVPGMKKDDFMKKNKLFFDEYFKIFEYSSLL